MLYFKSRIKFLIIIGYFIMDFMESDKGKIIYLTKCNIYFLYLFWVLYIVMGRILIRD